VFIHANNIKKTLENINFNQKNGNNAFSEVVFKMYNEKGKEIHLKSDKISEDEKDHFTFHNISLSFAMPNGENGTVTANTVKAFRADKTICEFSNNVIFKTDSGLTIKTEKSYVDFERKLASGSSNITLTRGNAKASSKKYLFDMGKNILTLIDEAKGCFKTDKVASNKIVICFSNEHSNSVKNLEAIGNASYVSLSYNLQARQSILYQVDSIEASDHVILLYKSNAHDYDIRSNRLHATLDKDGKISKVIATGSLIIKTNNATICADKGVFLNDKINVYGNVIISGEQGDILGNSAVLDMRTGEVSVDNSCGIINERK
jgi:hypothetical protein